MDWLDVAIVVAKTAVIFGFLLVQVMMTIWAERRVVAVMQQRIGPNRVGPFGLLQSLADGVKLFFKEDIHPANADRPIYGLAPMVSLVPAFMAFAIVPLGPGITIGGRTIQLQLTDLNVGVLFFLAMGSLMVYGVMLAGWASGSAYPLLGAVRASAQTLSYEMGMGLAVLAVVMWAGTMSTREIVDLQAGTYLYVIPRWFVGPQLPAFLLFMIAGFAEANRAPFDLPEAETELVGGYHTEYSGIKFAMFMMTEYVHIITTSAIAVTLFLGGWRGIHPPFLEPLWGVLWFLGKTGFLIFLFMWVRATFPRIRYDRLMRFGWRVLLPAGLVWVMITAVMVQLPREVDRTTLSAWTAVIFSVLFLIFAARVTRNTTRRRAALRAAGERMLGGGTRGRR
ncbi:MAG TPA: NADH-quinone oxidoreductase subunit NuoH [Actinomycetota bacterium]|nr:NADH-quinone oxidoreductase subunit NuoH [Actinomycetota bacterium]